MNLRSLLFVPADSDRKLAKSTSSPADVLILDLEDAVAESRKLGARTTAAEFIAAEASKLTARLFVRINPLEGPADTSRGVGDLAALVAPGLAGVVLPKTRSVDDLVRLGHYLDVLEARAGMKVGSVQMIPVATETAEAILTMKRFAGAEIPRLAGITWGAEDLSAAVGALSNREEDGRYSPLYDLAASLCLVAAAAAAVAPIETVYTDFKDEAGLVAACRASRRRGFRGRLAIHPDQVPILNEAYSSTEAERLHAQRIVDAFAQNPGAGTLSLDGAMIDKPHLTQARRTLGLPT